MAIEEIIIAKGSEAGKDPAVNWIFNDWHGGTMTLTRHLKGCYMDLMTTQFNNGYLTLDGIRAVLASDFGTSWPALQKKFRKISAQDKSVKVSCLNTTTGNLYPFEFEANEIYIQMRLNFETVKRKRYTKTLRDNLSSELPSENNFISPQLGNGNGIGEDKGKEKELEIFNQFRLLYPGRKRGNEIEFNYFKKNKDWKKVLPELLPALHKEIAWRKSQVQQQVKFIPEWKDLKTWIYNGCWSQEFTTKQTVVIEKKTVEEPQYKTREIIYPNFYDAEFEKSNPNETILTRYYQHLLKLGWIKEYVNGDRNGELVWVKKQVA